MGKKYKCTSSFQVMQCDDEGRFLETYKTIRQGGIYEVEDTEYRLAGDKQSIRLFNVRTNYWLEITKETLDRYFILIDKG